MFMIQATVKYFGDILYEQKLNNGLLRKKIILYEFLNDINDKMIS
jgi:hypothetical protein